MSDSTLNQMNLPEPVPAPGMRDELRAVVDTARPQTPGQFGVDLFKDKWGRDIDPHTALLVTLDYNYKGHPAQNGIHQGQVANSRTLLQALLGDYQTVGDGRFGETAFGLYTPPDIGPSVRIVEHVDEFANHGSGNHQTYEGVYRQTVPQTYGPLTQIPLKPADFKQWVWTLELKDLYQAYLERAWPSDEAIMAAKSYPLRTSVKAAFVMSAWLQRHENSLSQQGLELALQAAGLPSHQAWGTLTLKQLQAPTRMPSSIMVGRLELYRYTATDIWTWRERSGSRILLYIPGNSSPLHEFIDAAHLQRWIVAQGKGDDTKRALASHFAEADREDGTFHAGVLTALEGMVVYPNKHRLTKTAGLFNDDGYWDPAQYVGFEQPSSLIDPFAQLVLTMKRAAQASVDSIRDDAQVNRDNLSAVVEPIVQWVNRFGPLALFVPGGEGLLALAGLIDAGYGLDQAVNGETSTQRSEGVTRTVFGLLNALPLAAAGAAHGVEGAEAANPLERGREPIDAGQEPVGKSVPDLPVNAPPAPLPAEAMSRRELLRGIGSSVAGFSDETLAQIGKISAVDNDMLRVMHTGRPPTPLLGDTISRFRIDQDLEHLADGERTALFNSRYQALQQSDNDWVGLFQRQYPDLPKSAVEQMLDRYGVDLQSSPDMVEAKRLFSRLDSKARQYQQHVRLNRAYEGLYLRSMRNPESDTLALHSLPNLPGWPKGLRIDVLDASLNGRVLDRCGPLESTDVRRLIKTASQRYEVVNVAKRTDFHEAVLGVLSDSERAALLLPAVDPVGALKGYIGERALSRSELMTGLGRMDTGLPFETQGLRGGGFPTTAQAEALTQQMMRLQLQGIYPDFSNAEADELLQRVGAGAQAHIDGLKQQLQQLNADLSAWIDQVAQDIDDMDIPVLTADDEAAQGMNARQIAIHNAEQVQAVMATEHDTRTELAVELVSIWQKRALQGNRVYANGQLVGYRMDLAFEDYHRLPALNVRFNEVIELSMRRIQVTERESLNDFLESFPNLRMLNLEGVDLSAFQVLNAEDQLIRALPPSMARLHDLTSLNLRFCDLTFTDRAASQLSGMIRLQDLDLSDNPLDVPPLVLGMTDLRRLNLRNSGITTCPIGIMDQPYLTSLDLRDNRIARIPQAVINQAIARGRVQMGGNPLTDEDTLWRLIDHRERTGINLWLSEPHADYGEPEAWLRDIEEQQRDARLAIWQRLAAKPSGTRFLRVMDGVSLTPDFLVNYEEIQARAWRLLSEADASDELWTRLSRDVELAEDDADNPMAIFMSLENRARLYGDWVAMGRPFPMEVD
ncbi:leucine-rich repeat domain-containing protein [Pseudomonas sp. EL_65y_Pfl2_R96]|uniref:leucine-rich repeat domain-containing protein n=1 Tax=Pseudomonas sp. EL_65y_Pfl2_R96 TaxID=3088699 RepID=UPI0030D8FA46